MDCMRCISKKSSSFFFFMNILMRVLCVVISRESTCIFSSLVPASPGLVGLLVGGPAEVDGVLPRDSLRGAGVALLVSGDLGHFIGRFEKSDMKFFFFFFFKLSPFLFFCMRLRLHQIILKSRHGR